MNLKIENLIYRDLHDIKAKVNSVEYSLLSINRRLNVYRYLSLVLANQIEGEVVELGTYTGMTAVLIQETLNEFDSQKGLSLFDSFEGIPKSTFSNEKHREGTFMTHPQGDIENILLNNFHSRNLRKPETIRGWFSAELFELRLPEKISFCHLDSDMYESTKVSLQAIYPRMQKGGVVIVDDYKHPSWKGVCAAVENFTQKEDLIFYDLNFTSHIDDHQGLFIKSA